MLYKENLSSNSYPVEFKIGENQKNFYLAFYCPMRCSQLLTRSEKPMGALEAGNFRQNSLQYLEIADKKRQHNQRLYNLKNKCFVNKSE